MAIGITCGAPPIGEVGVVYTHTFPVSTPTAPTAFDISVGALPPGLVLNALTGAVTGTPTLAGTYGFTVHVSDAAPSEASVPCEIQINAVLGLTCGSPPDGEVGLAGYTHTFPRTGGTTPFVFTIPVGALPNGLAIAAATGIVTGTPTVAGIFAFTVRVTDSLGAVVDVPCSITIFTIGITCGSPINGKIGVPYSHTFPTTHGVLPFVFAITVGALPAGLVLDVATGIVTGTPTGPIGTTVISIQVTDAVGQVATVTCSISICTPNAQGV